MTLLSLLWCMGAFPAYGVTVGVGVSSHTNGRMIPALNLGYSTPDMKNYVGFTTAGVRTAAYYDNSYNMTFMRLKKWSGVFGGQVISGLGLGLTYAQKGLHPDPENRGVSEEKIQVDRDYQWGPAFRVAYYPTTHMYFGVEYTMGMGMGALGLGFGDTGLWALGVDF